MQDGAYTPLALASVPCPECGATGLWVEDRLVAVDPPSALAGMQMKVGTKRWPHLVCECGFSKGARS